MGGNLYCRFRFPQIPLYRSILPNWENGNANRGDGETGATFSVRLACQAFSPLHRAPPADQMRYRDISLFYKQTFKMTSHHLQPAGQNTVDLPLSRPTKRRRFYRKRTDTTEEDDEPSDGPSPRTAATPELQTVDQLISQNGGNGDNYNDAHHVVEEAPVSVSDLVRQRKAIQRRRGGIEFTNLNPSSASTFASGSSPANVSDALSIKHDDTPADIRSVIERFAPQTGQISETTDKYMYVLPV